MDAAVNREPRARSVDLNPPLGAGRFAYLDFGPPQRPVDVVFSHANGYNAFTYRSILGPLADDLRILALDLRGHGGTRAPTPMEGRRSWEDLGEDLQAFLSALDLGPVILAGHSMGATTSLLAAAAQPRLARALVLFEPVIMAAARVGEIGASPIVRGTLKRRRDFQDRAEALAAYVGRGGFKTWPEATVADYVEGGFIDQADGTITLACTPEWEVSNYVSQQHDSWAALQAVTCPITILAGDQGSSFRLSEEKTAELTASGRASVETIPGTTHFLPMERPDAVQAALRAAAAS